jgi:hypothetical protein
VSSLRRNVARLAQPRRGRLSRTLGRPVRRILLAAAVCGLAAPAGAAIDLQLIASGVPQLVGIEHAGDGSGRLFLVRQSGRIMIYDGNQVLATPFLDISGLVIFDGERGLLGLAFHPQYGTNGYFFVYYMSLSGASVIARYQVSANPNVANPGSGTVVIDVPQPPHTNHKAGQIRFGPDGFLYIALGDGGGSGDPDNRGQALDTMLGKLLRIDVNAASPYTIPPSNPFYGVPNVRQEIWALGVRNPWRFTFDRQTDDLFIGDVGQSLWEEIDFQPAGSPGGLNYGWRRMEGFHCYNPATGCNNAGSLTLPILEYSHGLGCSVTGGFRYRGAALASHVGAYFFADLCSGRIWGATSDMNGTWTAALLRISGFSVTTFGEDESGELYVSRYSDTNSGGLYKIVPGASPLPVMTLTLIGSGAGRVTSSPAAIECGSVCGAALAASSALTLAAVPDPGSTFVEWSGDPDCADGSLTMAGDRNCQARFRLLVPFTDDELSAGTPIKAVHVMELRTRIDGVRQAHGLPPYAWTDPALTPGVMVVKAIHVTEMRAALHDVFVVAGVLQPPYIDPLLGPGTLVKAAHIVDLRRAVSRLE